MDLPNDEIGISDILDYRECPQRFSLSIQRHLPMPEKFQLEPGEKADSPLRQSWATAYGSCVHDAIEVIENTQCSDDEALDAVWGKWQHWLGPDDLEDMKVDLQTYRTRSATGYRLIGTELEMRAPLFVHEGRMIYFRARIDVLYQYIDNPTVYLSRDYKSSRMPKSEEEVHKDIQQWAYNFVICENYPEAETLIQEYDQLKFGVIPTRKNNQQRAQIKAWLIRQVKAMLADQVMKPTSNEWCYTCPLMADCRVTHMAPEFWINRLGALAPERKEGRKVVVQLTDEHAGFEVYLDVLPKAKKAYKVMERFIAAVEDVIREMPAERRVDTGYRFGKPPKQQKFGPDELRKVHQIMGEEFWQVAGITKKALGEFYGENSAEYAAIINEASTTYGKPKLLAPRGDVS